MTRAVTDDTVTPVTTRGALHFGISSSGFVEVVGLASGLIVQVTVARELSQTDYGRFAALSIVELVILLLLGGIPQALRHLVSENPKNLPEAIRWLLLAQLPLSAGVALAITWGVVPLGYLTNDRDIGPLLPIISFAVFMRCGFLEPCLLLLNGNRSYATQAFVGIAYHVLRVVCVAWFSNSLGNLPLILTGLAIAAILSATLAVTFVWKLWRCAEDLADVSFTSRVRGWIRHGPGYELFLFLLAASNLWVVKSLVADPIIVGVYAACFTLARSSSAIGRVAVDGTFSRLTVAFSEGHFVFVRTTVIWTTSMLLLIWSPLLLLSIRYGEVMVIIIFGARYNGSGNLSGLLVASTGFSSMMMFFGGVLGAAGMLRIRLLAVTAVSLTGMAASVEFTRLGGSTGAAWSLLLTSAAGALGMAWLVRGVVCRGGR